MHPQRNRFTAQFCAGHTAPRS
uniref:Uncharacterized protein n=1 Tax=Anguilla anguilla TaxID=7936 RepID=A0A0E9VSQ7_ANGAN